MNLPAFLANGGREACGDPTKQLSTNQKWWSRALTNPPRASRPPFALFILGVATNPRCGCSE